MPGGALGRVRRVDYSPRYRLVNTDPDVLRGLQGQSRGSIYGHRGQHWSYELGQAMLAGTLEEILPYMHEKRRHAELVLQLVEVKENRRDREIQRLIVDRLLRLNSQKLTGR
jgi:hypothetical protein